VLRFLLPLLFLGSIQAYAKPLIIGGEAPAPKDPVRKSTVGVFDPSPDGRGGSLCTGSLIRKDMVVTAAHCIQPGGPKPVVIFGDDMRSPVAIRRESQSIAVNPKWQTNAGRGMDQGDIALIKMRGDAPKGYSRVPSIASESDIDSVKSVTIAGYGVSNALTHEGAGRLRRADVGMADVRKGASEMILDQRHGRGACHGDSGGPAFVKKGGRIALAGVTNRSYPNSAPDDCAHQSVYTKVPAYRNWIRSSEKKMDSATPVPEYKQHISHRHARRHRRRH